MKGFFTGIADRLSVLFDPQSLGHQAADLVANLTIGVVTFLAYYLLWRIADSVARIITRRVKADNTTRDFMLTILKFGILTLATVNALAAVGVNTASLITSLGIAGLTIGFAARDALSNLISGLLIYWDRPFVIGDLVEVGSHYGKVDRITLRSTRVITNDGKMLAVPNTEIINRTVASYTNFPHLRIDVAVTVGVDQDLDRVRAILLSLVEGSPGYLADPAPAVVVRQLNDFNVQLDLRVWALDERRHMELRDSLRESAFKALTAAGIDMPFETFRIEPVTVRQAAVT